MTNDIVQYMKSETVKARFAEFMGDRNAAAYISSVLLAVANNDTLGQCTPTSIYISALRAATLRLSVDPGIGQAYLVPFNSKNGKQAALIVGYKGLYDMAIRTGKYRYINVGKVYEGEEIVEDRITGFMHIEGGRTSDKAIGWLGAFELISGYGKVIYLTVEEIDAHAKQYSKTFDKKNNQWYPDSLWKINREAMERKQVLRTLIRKWGYLEPSDNSALEEAELDEVLDGEIIDAPPMPEQSELQPEQPRRTPAELIDQLGFPDEIVY